MSLFRIIIVTFLDSDDGWLMLLCLIYYFSNKNDNSYTYSSLHIDIFILNNES